MTIIEMIFSTSYNSSICTGNRKLPVKRASRRKFDLTHDNNPLPILENSVIGATLVSLFEPSHAVFSKVFSISCLTHSFVAFYFHSRWADL